MLDALLSGFAANGDAVDTVLLAEKRIQYCLGCYTCWSATPGVCVHHDDMGELIPRLGEADYILLGSPLYFNNVIDLCINNATIMA